MGGGGALAPLSTWPWDNLGDCKVFAPVQSNSSHSFCSSFRQRVETAVAVSVLRATSGQAHLFKDMGGERAGIPLVPPSFNPVCSERPRPPALVHLRRPAIPHSPPPNPHTWSRLPADRPGVAVVLVPISSIGKPYLFIYSRKGVTEVSAFFDIFRDNFLIAHCWVGAIACCVFPSLRQLPLWDARGAVVVLFLHVGLSEPLFYWAHRALHSSFLFHHYHFLHHSSKVPQSFTGTYIYVE